MDASPGMDLGVEKWGRVGGGIGGRTLGDFAMTRIYNDLCAVCKNIAWFEGAGGPSPLRAAPPPSTNGSEAA